MTTSTVPLDVKAYLRAVRARLDDLPAEERDDLLADVEPSILDSAEESDAPVESQLGPPHSFADELRAAAGLPPRVDDADDVPKRGLRDRLAAARAFFASSPSTRWLRELAPLWWVLRGIVAVGLVEVLYGESVFGAGSEGYALVVALAVVSAVAVSVAVGLRRPRRNAALTLVNLVLALAAAPVLWSAVNAGHAAVFDDRAVAEEPFAVATSGLAYEGEPVRNIYAFDREGRLLQDVRLFNEDGRPIEIGGNLDPNRRPVLTLAGDRVFNAFPIRYFEPGTSRVANPAAGAPANPRPLATKPLRP